MEISELNERIENARQKERQIVTKTHDDFNGWTDYASAKIGFQNSDDLIKLEADKYVNDKTHEVSYNLYVFYVGKDWIFIKPGESLIFLADGKRIAINSDEGSVQNRSVDSEAFVHELATYSTTAKFIKKLGSANEVRVRVETMDGTLSQVDRSLWLEFLKETSK